MNQRISFYSLSATSDGQGGKKDESESLVDTVWAEMKEMSGYKKLQFNQLIAGKPYEIRIRKNNSIDENHIIGISTRRMMIHSLVEDNEYKGFQYIVAVEK